MFDFLNIILISVFAFFGFYRGFIREVAGLAIFLVAAIISLHFAIPLDYVISKSLPFPLLSTVLSHIIIFFSILTATKLFFLKTIIHHIKFISTGSDGMLGALFGGLKGLMTSLVIFSCLYISGASNSLGLKNTMFYKIDHALYSKLALFVKEGEIATLGRIKHVDNADENEESYTETSNKIVELPSVQQKPVVNQGNEYLNSIVQVFRGKTILNSQDDEILNDILLLLPDANINSIFETCCKDVAHTKEILGFSDDELSVYIADLIIYEYKKNGFVMDETKNVLAKKIDVFLLSIYDKKIVEKVKTKPNVSENSAVKILTDSSIVPLPLKDTRRSYKVNINSNKKILIKNINSKALSPQLNKQLVIPFPKRRDIVLNSISSVSKSPTQVYIPKKNNIQSNDSLAEEDVDINVLIEESLKKSG